MRLESCDSGSYQCTYRIAACGPVAPSWTDQLRHAPPPELARVNEQRLRHPLHHAPPQHAHLGPRQRLVVKDRNVHRLPSLAPSRHAHRSHLAPIPRTPRGRSPRAPSSWVMPQQRRFAQGCGLSPTMRRSVLSVSPWFKKPAPLPNARSRMVAVAHHSSLITHHSCVPAPPWVTRERQRSTQGYGLSPPAPRVLRRAFSPMLIYLFFRVPLLAWGKTLTSQGPMAIIWGVLVIDLRRNHGN